MSRKGEEIRNSKNEVIYNPSHKKMKYLTNVFKEPTFKTLSSRWIFTRESKEETTIRKTYKKRCWNKERFFGLFIDMKIFWENPHEFDPSRHEDKRSIQNSKLIYPLNGRKNSRQS